MFGCGQSGVVVMRRVAEILVALVVGRLLEVSIDIRRATSLLQSSWVAWRDENRTHRLRIYQNLRRYSIHFPLLGRHVSTALLFIPKALGKDHV